MSFLCCGVKYTKNNPETYWRIETDFINIQAIKEKEISEKAFEKSPDKLKCFKIFAAHSKKEIGEVKVFREVVESLTCKNGCSQVKITRLGRPKGIKKILGVEHISHEEADLYLGAIEALGLAVRQPQISPIILVPFANNIPVVFGKAISPTKQRKCYYMSKPLWADKFSNCYIVDRWVPDIVESEIKISSL